VANGRGHAGTILISASWGLVTVRGSGIDLLPAAGGAAGGFSLGSEIVVGQMGYTIEILAIDGPYVDYNLETYPSQRELAAE
jgi:hypothetical protein